MLKINHAICPKCSIGCGINLISKDGFIVGINPFKNHEINEGKNCKNCIDYINQLSTINFKEFDYDEPLAQIKNKLNTVDKDNVVIITSGNSDTATLDKIIEYTQQNDYKLLTYEYNFTKIDSDLIASYDEIEQAEKIITIGDIFRNNSLIARRIIHAQEKNAETSNIHTEENLTGYNSNQFIKIDSYDNLCELIDSSLPENTIVVINEIDSKDNYEKLVELIKDKNIKILPLLKHPNSFTVLEKTNPSSLDEITNAINESELVIFINENPLEYLDSVLLENKQIISLTEDDTGLGLKIPVRLWSQMETSFTNSMGTTQTYPDAIQDESNNLKTVTEILELI